MAAERSDYPSHYKPGTHWATDEAWRIMDLIPEGSIAADLRFLLAGMIAGVLMRGKPKVPSQR